MHERTGFLEIPGLVENNSNAQKRAAVAEAIPRLHGSFATATASRTQSVDRFRPPGAPRTGTVLISTFTSGPAENPSPSKTSRRVENDEVTGAKIHRQNAKSAKDRQGW
jgi:hypothetical protein